MRFFLLLMVLTTTAFGSDQCVSDDSKVKICQQFVQNVLKQSVFKDEKEAIRSLSSYEPSKLALENQKCFVENARKTCTKTENNKSYGCETAFDVLGYFKGLVKEMKKNGWSPKTVSLGEATIQKHVDYVLASEPSLLDTLVTFTILKDAQSQGLLKGQYKNADAFLMEGEKVSQELQKHKGNSKTSLSCDQMKTIHQKEVAATSALIKKWKSKS